MRKKTKWNQDKKENFVSKDFIRKSHDLLRKMNSPFLKDKSVLATDANKLYAMLGNKEDNRRILFRNLKERHIYKEFLSYIDIPNNIYKFAK